MFEKVLKLGIKQNKRDFIYYIHNGDVFAKPYIRPGQKHFRTVKLASTGIVMDKAYVYSLDKAGDIVRIKHGDVLPFFFGVKKRAAKTRGARTKAKPTAKAKATTKTKTNAKRKRKT